MVRTKEKKELLIKFLYNHFVCAQVPEGFTISGDATARPAATDAAAAPAATAAAAASAAAAAENGGANGSASAAGTVTTKRGHCRWHITVDTADISTVDMRQPRHVSRFDPPPPCLLYTSPSPRD